MAVDSSSQRIDVFLFAENRLLRETLAKVLGKKSDLRIVGASALDANICGRIADLKPHVLLFDSTVYASSGVEIITATRRLLPGLKILMIGMDADEEMFLRCVRAGVAGFVLKEASAVEIATAVRDVAYDGAVCPPTLCLLLFNFVARHAVSMPAYYQKLNHGLTRREHQLAHLLTAGLSNKEIAAQLNLSEQTIKNHIHRILRKLGAHDRLGAAEVCRQRGLVV